ncbi:hypothetical protein PFICI_00153 [Pestalotiopsis fici W106-1]|uniref:Uncharacterized protein n=1 Tax=Pestalotiopsis fici (strain W106-1 / CGMCC3.15140) TaxID=1229662 RepID=W3XJZ8_PESFW|nr:uncharacterized protein PFICI_00153 [Pestalotiopsis fici W106-1]ETS86325.1 hypothetical protein PFICI_00153 [Pestalotiopsis fici W106-1]
MYADVTAHLDMTLPPANHHTQSPHTSLYERSSRLESIHSPHLSNYFDPVNYLSDFNLSALASGVDFNTPSITDDELLHGSLPDSEQVYDTNVPWPMFNLQSQPPQAHPIATAERTTTNPPSVTGGTAQRISSKPSKATTTTARKAKKPHGTRASSSSHSSSQRPHYAVEKRYRSGLNEKYAALTRILSSDAVQRICRTERPEWGASVGGGGVQDEQQQQRSRQQKTTTLSATIEAIAILSRCCAREARELEVLRRGVQDTTDRVRRVLEMTSGGVAASGRSEVVQQGQEDGARSDRSIERHHVMQG